MKIYIFLVLILLFILIILFWFNKEKNAKEENKMEKSGQSSKNLVLIMAIASSMMALGAILKVFGIMLNANMRIAFFALPIMLSGLICGMEYGILTAIGADLIYSLFSGYAFNPAFTLSAVYWGILGGVFRILKNKNKLNIVVIFLGILIASLLETHTNLVVTYILYGTYTTIASLITKYIVLIIKLPILSLLLYVIDKRVIDKINILRSIK